MHIGTGSPQTVGLVIVSTGLGSEGSYREQVLDNLVAGFAGVHAGQHLNPVQHFVVRNVVKIERDITEKTGQRPVKECTQGFGLAKQLIVLLLAENFVLKGPFDPVDGEIASLNAEIALCPDGRTEARHGGRDVQTGIERTRRTICNVGDTLRGDHVGIVVDRFDRNIAAVHNRLTFREFTEKVIGAGNSGRILVQRTRLKQKEHKAGGRKDHMFDFHRFHAVKFSISIEG